jgi:hypothetical protein
MLPDLDSDSGVPVRETLSAVSMLVPMLLIQRLGELQLTHEQMVLLGAIVYFAVRFGVGALFRRFTVHRGMWHSIPAALASGFLVFLLCDCEFQTRFFKAWAIVVGYMSHLILDELYSIDLAGHRIRIKSSFGSAVKFFGERRLANVVAYGGLLLMAGLVWVDPAFQRELQSRGVEPPMVARQLEQAVPAVKEFFQR